MNNIICKSDYEKFKRQFDIKMGNEATPLAIILWAVMGIIIGGILMMVSTEKGYTINIRAIPIYLPFLISTISYKGIKYDLGIFIGLGYKRKRYFINEKVMQSIMFLMIAFFMSMWIIIMKKDKNFWYLGFLFKSGFISFLKSIIVNYVFITLISVIYLIISLMINNLGEILFKKNSEKIIPIFLIFVLPVLITSFKIFISNYNMRVLTYISPIIILIETYFEYKIIKNMDA